MYEFLLGLSLLTGGVQMPPECNDPQIIEMISKEAQNSLPPGLTVEIKRAYPIAVPDEAIGLRKCEAEMILSYVLLPTPQTVLGTFDIQTTEGNEFVLRLRD